MAKSIAKSIVRTVIILIVVIMVAACNKKAEKSSQVYKQTTQTTSNLPLTPENEAIVKQTIYVPAYSHIYHGNEPREINLAITLSFRNTDTNNAIALKSVQYYDTEGRSLHQYINQPIMLAPMATREFVVEEDNTAGGSGANFVIEWYANKEVTDPIAESVMISTQSSQGISFTSAGRAIKTTRTYDITNGISK